MSFAHPRRTALALTLAASLALTACGGGEKKQEETPDAKPTPTPEAPVFSPLTGAKVDANPEHPIVVVKIDNSRASAPQVGLGSADLVAEELVEGGITRLAVFFDSRIPKNVGPVRSMRATDIGVVQPAKAVLVASGGAPQTVSRVAGAKIKTYTEGAKGYFREGGRRAPYNLFMRLGELVGSLKGGDRPETYLPFAEDPSTFPQGTPAAGLQAKFSFSQTTDWTFQNGKYVNTNSFAAKGDTFEPETVLVLRVKVGDAGYTDPAGNPVPETKLTGKGQAMIFHGGNLVRGKWSKAGFGAPLSLSTQAGELQLPPGKVWIELVPQVGGDVIVKK